MTTSIALPLRTDRRCASCGAPEHRVRDPRGVVSTNLNPLTGTCLECVIEAAKVARLGEAYTPALFDRDPKQRAANDVE